MRLHRRSVVALAVLVLLGNACLAGAAGDEVTSLRIVLADDWAAAPAVIEAIEDFEVDHPGVTVTVQASPFSQIPELVGGAIDLGEPHDVAHWHAFAAAAAGLAEPVDDLWVDFGLREQDYLPGAVDGVTWVGTRYGVPLDTNALVLFVNEALLADALEREADLSTIDGFRQALGEVVLRDDEHVVSVSSSSWTTYGWIVAHGGSLVTIGDDGTPTFTFEDPATVRALDFLADLVRDGHAPRPAAPDLAAEAVQAFSSGESLLLTSGSWDLPQTWRAPAISIPPHDVSIRPLPQVAPQNPRTVLGGSSLFVPVGSEHRELGFELIQYLTEDELALRLVREEGRLPAKGELLTDDVFTSSDDLRAFVAQLEHAEVMTLIAYPDVAAAFREGLESVLSGRRPAADAMADVQRYAEAWLEKGGG